VRLLPLFLLTSLAVNPPKALAQIAPKCWISSQAQSSLGLMRKDANIFQGRVMAVQTGDPFPEAMVTLVPDSLQRYGASAVLRTVEGARYASTDSAGRFRLTEVAPGPYRLRVRFIGFASVDASVTVGQSGLAIVASLAPALIDHEACVTPAVRPPAT
jgi:hypothetical protein